jgi:hypothetical protein
MHLKLNKRKIKELKQTQSSFVYLTKHHAKQTYGEVDVQLHSSDLDGNVWLASLSSNLGPRNEPDTHWIRSWVGPRDGLDVVAKRKVLSEIELRSSSP